MSDSLSLRESYGYALTHSYAIEHAISAAYLAEAALAIEAQWNGRHDARINAQHRGLVVSAVMVTIAMAEASINELYWTCTYLHEQMIATGLAEADILRARDYWRSHGRAGLYRRYCAALQTFGREVFVREEFPWQGLDLVIGLRNVLVHANRVRSVRVIAPGDTWSNEPELAGVLRGRFSENPLVGEGSAFFPDRCLSAGCAR